MLILILIFSENDSVKVAADQVAEDDADIDAEDLEGMGLEEGYRHACVVECICHAVGEATYDEERNREQEREHVAFTGECNRCSHEQTARDAEEAACERSGLESELEDPLRRSLDVHRRHARKKSETETSDDVSEENEEELTDLVLVDETCCTCIKLELVSYHGHESDGEENRSNEWAISL